MLWGQSSRTICLSKFGDFCGQATVAYRIDNNHISLGFSHYGCPEAVEKTVVQKVEAFEQHASLARRIPPRVLAIFKHYKKMQQTFLFFGK